MEKLYAGDVIMFCSRMFVAGDPRGKRTTTVVKVSTMDKTFPIQLKSDEMVPKNCLMKRLKSKTGQAYSSPDGKWRYLKDYALVPGELKLASNANSLSLAKSNNLAMSEFFKQRRKGTTSVVAPTVQTEIEEEVSNLVEPIKLKHRKTKSLISLEMVDDETDDSKNQNKSNTITSYFKPDSLVNTVSSSDEEIKVLQLDEEEILPNRVEVVSDNSVCDLTEFSPLKNPVKKAWKMPFSTSDGDSPQMRHTARIQNRKLSPKRVERTSVINDTSDSFSEDDDLQVISKTKPADQDSSNNIGLDFDAGGDDMLMALAAGITKTRKRPNKDEFVKKLDKEKRNEDTNKTKREAAALSSLDSITIVKTPKKKSKQGRFEIPNGSTKKKKYLSTSNKRTPKKSRTFASGDVLPIKISKNDYYQDDNTYRGNYGANKCDAIRNKSKKKNFSSESINSFHRTPKSSTYTSKNDKASHHSDWLKSYEYSKKG